MMRLSSVFCCTAENPLEFRMTHRGGRGDLELAARPAHLE
jgi:hypothetical protein